ncbi:unnamed protein product, partial [Mesorhabditis belari]|uniref:GST C-terminal domain-containing protein n=1 Tax=Mesorhabditis belari TaxID=2138241 RepID=A0AAF3EWW2_9BILA
MGMILWLRAGSDGTRLGGDPLSHHLFMLLLLKGEQNEALKFEVRTVNESKPPPEFRELGLRKPPAISDENGETFTHEDDIIDYLEQWIPQRRVNEADDVTSDLFRHFAFFIKDVNKDPKGLLGELHRLDEYLGAAEFPYLTGNSLAYLDSLILTRLHSIRISAQALKDFSIPDNLKNLWAYMERGYTLPIFQNSCPSDQEIILYWAERPDTPNISSQKRAALYRQKSTHTFTCPSNESS